MRDSSQDLAHSIVHAETWFPRSFADASMRSWGVLFHTPSIPESHDGNHACILDHGGRPAAAVQEVISFYQSKDLQPRVNLVSTDGDDLELRAALKHAGFEFGYEDAMRIYVFRHASRIVPNPNVIVRRVMALDEHLLAAISDLNCPRVAKVLQRRMRHGESRLFVGECEGQPVSVALLEPAERLWRVDEVHTHQGFRGRGCARAVIHALATFYENRANAPLYLWTDNPVAERLYAEAGFERLAVILTSWCSWLPDQENGVREREA